MAQSSIEWTEMTWNPTTGCTKISAGCKFSYAEVMSRRLESMGVDKYKDGFKLKTHEDALNIPYTWKKAKVVFVNSMSDLFHEDVTLAFIKKVFAIMNDNPQHVFQVLTKRSKRLLELHTQLKWSHNICMGVSVENEKVMNRIEDLRQAYDSKFFFKQWGGTNKKKAGRLLAGKTYDEMPEIEQQLAV
jgi:protein gp37